MMRGKRILVHLGACKEAVQWVGDRPLHLAWRQCERGDWMLWLAAMAGVDRKVLVFAACQCARTALPYTTGPRPRLAIEAAEGWCSGKVSIEEVRAAAHAAYAAYAAYAVAYVACAAADAAADAAYSAACAACAACAAHAAADAACAACAAYVARADAVVETHKRHAIIVRRLIPWRMVRDGIIEVAKKRSLLHD